MKMQRLGTSGLSVPRVVVGCMRMTGLSLSEAERFINYCVENGANYFDHADIYGKGRCEEIFSSAYKMTPSNREKIILQSKCGIRKDLGTIAFDFSKEYILQSVDGILKRLKTDYLDVLLLHRPDILCEPDEVAEAFDILFTAKKVRHFGVSNHNPAQIELLKKSVKQPLITNQLQFGLGFSGLAARGAFVNMNVKGAVNRDGGALDYCRQNDITVQAWSPFQVGFFRGTIFNRPTLIPLNMRINKLAAKYNVTNTAIALAWILRHPALIQPVTGTMTIGRMGECIKAADIELAREEWYSLLAASGVHLP